MTCGLLDPPESGGYGLDAQWSDDFHHAVHAFLTGERTNYYADFGRPEQIVKAINHSFVYDGIYSPFRGRRHGAPAGDHSGDRFVVAIQNHDQIGNRPRGDRLGTILEPEQQRLAAGLLLLAPRDPADFHGGRIRRDASLPVLLLVRGPANRRRSPPRPAERICVRGERGRSARSAGARDLRVGEVELVLERIATSRIAQLVSGPAGHAPALVPAREVARASRGTRRGLGRRRVALAAGPHDCDRGAATRIGRLLQSRARDRSNCPNASAPTALSCCARRIRSSAALAATTTPHDMLLPFEFWVFGPSRWSER